MKILLIHPHFLEKRIHEEEISVVPIGLYYVGAVLKENGHDVEILNWYNANQKPGFIEKALREKQPDVIGVSIFHANRWGGVEIARAAKKIDAGVKVVFGGIGATFLWKHLLTRFREIDFIVLGEGELKFLELVNCIRDGNERRLDDVPGIAFRKGAEVVKTKDADLIRDLDELPNPSQYFSYQHLSSSRGCPGNCTFCGSPRFWGRRVRFHSPAYFVDQIQRLYERGTTFFYVSDDTFTVKKDRVIEICREILQRGLKIAWAAIARVNHVDEEVLLWMRKAGCIQISYGVESGSEQIRGLLNKNIEEDQVKRAFALTTTYGILSRAYFIYGCPGESPATISETIDLIDEIKPLSVIFYILDLFPGTALYQDAERRLKLTDDVWLKRVEDILYFETDPELTQEAVLEFGKRLRTAYYENIHRYVDAIELIDRKDLYELHADFLSRLALTFSHGDYAGIDAIREKDKIAEKLFRRALEYHPDHRAYLGLGMLEQQKRDFAGAIEILEEGIAHYPQSENLRLCIGISLMNLGKFQEALSHLLKIEHSEEAAYYLSACRQALEGKG